MVSFVYVVLGFPMRNTVNCLGLKSKERDTKISHSLIVIKQDNLLKLNNNLFHVSSGTVGFIYRFKITELGLGTLNLQILMRSYFH